MRLSDFLSCGGCRLRFLELALFLFSNRESKFENRKGKTNGFSYSQIESLDFIPLLFILGSRGNTVVHQPSSNIKAQALIFLLPVTKEELIAFDGSDLKKPLLMAIKGQIYDVTHSRFCRGATYISSK